ncbi:MAG TPA: hypothetical protein VK585_07205 [Jiangellaceae bacterium]|nr:hypothetical protein [Jiangellaceae bacterium]
MGSPGSGSSPRWGRCPTTSGRSSSCCRTLGLSSLVDIVAHGADEHATESTILGPFYVPGAPWRELGDSIAESDDAGAPTLVTGSVRSVDGSPLRGAVLDIWQTASNGLYAVQEDAQPDGNLRGRFRAAGDGRYRFWTVRPVSYAIPDDGRPSAGCCGRANATRGTWSPTRSSA